MRNHKWFSVMVGKRRYLVRAAEWGLGGGDNLLQGGGTTVEADVRSLRC